MAFITRLSKSSKRLFGTLLLALSLNAAAEGISVTRSEAKLTETGQLSVSSRFRTDLPDQLKQALRQGVPLNFTLSWQLSAPSMPSYRFKFDQLLNSDNTILQTFLPSADQPLPYNRRHVFHRIRHA